MNEPIIPSLCSRCGALFQSRGFGGGTGVTYIGNTESCPFCGGDAQVLDGTYGIATSILDAVKATHVSKLDLLALEALVRKAYAKPAEAESIFAEIEKISPPIGVILKLLAKKRLKSVGLLMLIWILSTTSPREMIQAGQMIMEMVDKPPSALICPPSEKPTDGANGKIELS